MNTITHPDTFAGLTTRQVERYSIAELIAATARDDQKTLGFYREVSDAVSLKTGQQQTSMRGFFLPGEYLQRDMTAAGTAGSQYLVGQSTGFSGALYATSVVAKKLPLRRAALTGNAQMAVVTTAPTTTWLSAEDAQIADGAMVFGSRSATPKTVATTMFVSKQLDLQSPGAAAFVEVQAAAALAQAIDAAFVSGSGGGQPTGLLTLSGTTSQPGTSLDYSGVCSMIAAAEGRGGQPHVLMGTTAARLLRQRAKVSGGTPIFDGGSVDGLPTVVSKAVPDDAMLVFDPTLIVDVRFGALEVVVSPLATPAAFRTGAIGVRLIAAVDFTVDHPATVSKSTSIT